MTIALERAAASRSGRVESQATYPTHAHPHCPLQELQPQGVRPAVRAAIRADGRGFRLYPHEKAGAMLPRLFAGHDAPSREVALLSTARSAIGGALSEAGWSPR
jgi:hypothetical protein